MLYNVSLNSLKNCNNQKYLQYYGEYGEIHLKWVTNSTISTLCLLLLSTSDRHVFIIV
jgi:hypothetical protein